MSSKQNLFRVFKVVALSFGITAICGSKAQAFNEPDMPLIFLSDTVFTGNSAKMTVVIKGESRIRYVVAINQATERVFIDGEDLNLDNNAVIIAEGTLDSDGVDRITFTLPLAERSKTRIQAAVVNGRKYRERCWHQQFSVSPVSTVTQLGAAAPGTSPVVTGEKGDKGDRGDRGEIGPVGATGAAGRQGESGAPGVAGAPGATGEKGEKGDVGPTGPPGGSAAPAIWSGGCSAMGRSGGWNKYCADIVDFNTSSEFLAVDPTGTTTVLKSGYYRVNMFSIVNTAGTSLLRISVNGVAFAVLYEASNDTWTTNSVDQTLKCNAGDTIEVEYLNNGGNSVAFHSWLPNGSQSRLQISLVGQL